MLLSRLPFNWSGKVRSSGEGKEDGDAYGAEEQETTAEEQEEEGEGKRQKEIEKKFDPKVWS